MSLVSTPREVNVYFVVCCAKNHISSASLYKYEDVLFSCTTNIPAPSYYEKISRTTVLGKCIILS